MANLGAIVDAILHPEIEYLDEEHLVVGAITGLMNAFILFSMLLYFNRLDRTKKRQEEDQKALAVSEEKYRAIFENSIDAIYLKTPGGRFVDINPAGVALFGYDSRQELLGADISNDLYVRYSDWVTGQQMMEKDGFVENFEVELKKKDGERIHVVESGTAIYNGEGEITGYRGIMRDVTAQMQMEAELGQAQKLESIGRMAGGVAHDFNNYLTTMSGQAEMAIGQVPADSQIMDSLNEIRRSIEKASSLTRQLQLFSRSQPLNLEPIDLNLRLSAASRQLTHVLGEAIEVRIQTDEKPCVVDADSGALAQVLISLALYSRRHMPVGGHIDVLTEHVKLDEEYAMSHVEAYPGEFVCVKLSDDSEGMDDEAVEHFFEPFYSATLEQDGMVLAVAYGIIMQHGGWIEVESTQGVGTAYKIFLPISEHEVRQSARSCSSRGCGERILLVEDEEAVRGTIERMLSDNGYEVLTAVDAKQAFDIFVSEKGDIQLVFSDVVLPGESGVELVEHLRSHNGSLPVVLSSGYTDKTQDLDTIRDREYRFLQKPFSLPDLLETVRETLETPAPAA